MSVVHKMLQDLDARGAAAPMTGMEPGPAKPSTTARWRLPVIGTVGVAAIALTAFGDWPARLGLAGARPQITVPAPVAIVAPAAVAETSATIATPAAPDSAAVALQPAPPAEPALAAVSTAGSATIATVQPRPGATTRADAGAQSRTAARTATHSATRTSTATAAHAPARSAANTAAEQALTLRADSGLLPPLNARVEKRASAGQIDSRAQLAYRQAVAAAQAGQRISALQLAHETIALEPRLWAARQLAAVLEHESGQTDRATQVLREGLALDARQSTLALLLARLLVTQGNSDAALAVLSDHSVPGGEADGLRGGVWAQRGEFKNSLIAYESALRQQPGNSIWWLGLGLALESDGQAQRARQAYGRAQTLGLPREDLSGYVDQRLRALE